MILVTPKQEMERKSEWFCGMKFFRSKFKVEWENGVWTKIRFLASGFFVHMRQFHLDFYCFFDFSDWIFFLNGFSNPFIVRFGFVFLVNENSLNCTSGLVLLFFVSSSDALFSFYICSHRKAEKVKFSEWLLPLTNGISTRDVISHSL